MPESLRTPNLSEGAVKVAVISDLHLGRGDKLDLFWHEDDEFVRFLKFLERNFERIILLGDIYETLAARPAAQLREIKRIREAHPEIVKRFDRPQYEFLYGNHDLVLSKQGAKGELDLEADGVRMHFRHGHHFDWMVRHTPWIAEYGVWLGFAFARWGLDWFFKLGEKIEHWLRIKDGPLPFERWAFEMASTKEADIIVTGHTHHGKRSEHDERLFLNSGACYKNHTSWLSLDTKKGCYSHLKSW